MNNENIAMQVAAEEALRAAEYERCRAEALMGRLAAAEGEVAALGQVRWKSKTGCAGKTFLKSRVPRRGEEAAAMALVC